LQLKFQKIKVKADGRQKPAEMT